MGGRALASRVFSGSSTDEGWTVGGGVTYIGKGIESTNSLDRDFKEYKDSALIVRVSPRGNFIKMNKGISSNIEKGMMLISSKRFFWRHILVLGLYLALLVIRQ